MENLEQLRHPSYLTLPSLYTTAFFTSSQEALEVTNELVTLGFDANDFSVLEGPQGVNAIDLEGKKHSFWSEYRRKISKLAGGAEWHFLNDADNELRNAHVLLLVPTPDKEDRETVIKCFKKNGGFGIRSTTHFTIEELN